METKNLSDFEKEFFKMRTTGYSVRDIAKKLKKSTNTVCRLNKKYFREITDIKNAKLEDLQKKIIEQKKERLEFLKEQLYILNSKIYSSEIIMRYEEMVKLALKISDSINKCEKEMMITEIRDAESSNSGESDNTPITNVIGDTADKITENQELTPEKNSTDNIITNNTDLNSENQPKLQKQTKNKKNGQISEEKNEKNVIENVPPRTRADFYRRALKNNTKAPT
jgi:transposase